MSTEVDKNNNTPESVGDYIRSRQWMPVLSRGGLLLAVIFSALGVAYLAQTNRHLFSEFEMLRREEAALDAQWSRLLLERGTLVSQVQLERKAHQLQMYKPAPSEMVVVR